MMLLVRQGEKFSPRYVELFERFDPVTLTDQTDTPGRTRPLQNGYTGWTAKMELFAPWNADLRPAVYMDLDTLVLDDISDILSFDIQDLWLIREFNPNMPHRSESGLMLIPKNTDHIWAEFLKRGAYQFADGPFLNNFPHKVMNDRFPGIVSYKYHCLAGPQGRICCFHGRPKPHECTDWVAGHFQPQGEYK